MGSVKLSVGDALRAAAESRITAAGAVTIIGNSVAADAAGAVIELSGVIHATSVQITGSDRDDVVSLTSVCADTPVTIDAGAGSDIIRVGSAATADSNVGGRIDTVVGHLTVRGGADGDTLHIDDSGHDRATSGKLTSTTVTWPGRSGVITYEGIEDLRVALGSGADSLTVASTPSGTTVTLDAGAGDDTVELRGGDHTLNAIGGSLVLLGGPGSNRLRAFDTFDDGPNSGKLSGTQLTGLGMAGTVQYGDMAELLIELGQGDDTLTVLGTRGSTEVRGHAGHDQLVVSGDLGQITKPLLFRGGTASGDTDTLRVSASVSCDLQLDKVADPPNVQSDPLGVITGAGMSGSITFKEVEQLELALSDEQDWLTILDTTTTLSVMAGSGADQLTVRNVSHPTTVTVGDGNDTVVIHGAEAPVIVRGEGDGHDTLILDRSTQTAGLTPEDGASIEDGIAGQGVIRHVVSGDVTFDFVETVIVELGQGNDTFTIDLALEDTTVTVTVDGGGGDDTIRIQRIGDVVDTIVSGGTGQDSVHVYIDDFPQAEQFTRLRLNVETLTVDNADNTTGVTWTLVNGEILMADDADDQTSASARLGDRHVRCRSYADPGWVRTGQPAPGHGYGEQRHRSGFGQPCRIADRRAGSYFRGFRHVPELRPGVRLRRAAGERCEREYDEDGFRLQTTDGTVLVRDTSISAAARTSGEIELVSIDGTGQPDGSGFVLYSVDLAATGVGDAAVTFRGTTLSGATVQQSFTVTAGTVATVQLGPQFTALTGVTWTPGTETLALTTSSHANGSFRARQHRTWQSYHDSSCHPRSNSIRSRAR